MIEKVKLDPLHSSNIEFISERWYQVQQALLMGSQRNNLNSPPGIYEPPCYGTDRSESVSDIEIFLGPGLVLDF